MEGFALDHDVVLVAEFFLDLVDFLAGEAGDDAVNECGAYVAVVFEPCAECLVVRAEIFFPEVDVFEDDFFQMVAVFEDKLAGHDDEAFVSCSVEGFESAVEELCELAGIRCGGAVVELAFGIEGDAGFGGVGDDEAHFGLVGQREEGVELGEGAETAADHVDTGEGVDHFAVETALEVYMVEVVLTLEKLHHECVGGTLYDYNR